MHIGKIVIISQPGSMFPLAVRVSMSSQYASAGDRLSWTTLAQVHSPMHLSPKKLYLTDDNKRC